MFLRPIDRTGSKDVENLDDSVMDQEMIFHFCRPHPQACSQSFNQSSNRLDAQQISCMFLESKFCVTSFA